VQICTTLAALHRAAIRAGGGGFRFAVLVSLFSSGTTCATTVFLAASILIPGHRRRAPRIRLVGYAPPLGLVR
jgi:hypothetical protein